MRITISEQLRISLNVRFSNQPNLKGAEGLGGLHGVKNPLLTELAGLPEEEGTEAVQLLGLANLWGF